jgi:hypothetical protein
MLLTVLREVSRDQPQEIGAALFLSEQTFVKPEAVTTL